MNIQPIAKIAQFDLALSNRCLNHRFNQQVAIYSRFISHTGDGPLYALIGLLVWLIDSYMGRLFFIAGLFAFAIELPIYWCVKNSVKRLRPKALADHLPAFIIPSDRYSFPSGHTAAAFLMATLIQCFYPEWGSIAFIWASLIAMSRVLLGVHFFSDIVIGAVLGTSCATFAFTLLGN